MQCLFNQGPLNAGKHQIVHPGGIIGRRRRHRRIRQVVPDFGNPWTNGDQVWRRSGGRIGRLHFPDCKNIKILFLFIIIIILFL
jgi:hypothetical protein